jgi:hypothetical protein
MVEANIPQGAVEDRSGLLKSERAFVERVSIKAAAIAPPPAPVVGAEETVAAEDPFR